MVIVVGEAFWSKMSGYVGWERFERSLVRKDRAEDQKLAGTSVL